MTETWKGSGKLAKKYKKMAEKSPEVTAKAVTDCVIKIEDYAIGNVTGGKPLFVSSGVGKASINHRVKRGNGSTVGTVGTWSKHMKFHEDPPAYIYPKKGKYLKFQVGRGMSPASRRKRGQWVQVERVKTVKRPWLEPASKRARPFVKRRLERIMQDLIKAAS